MKFVFKISFLAVLGLVSWLNERNVLGIVASCPVVQSHSSKDVPFQYFQLLKQRVLKKFNAFLWLFLS